MMKKKYSHDSGKRIFAALTALVLTLGLCVSALSAAAEGDPIKEAIYRLTRRTPQPTETPAPEMQQPGADDFDQDMPAGMKEAGQPDEAENAGESVDQILGAEVSSRYFRVKLSGNAYLTDVTARLATYYPEYEVVAAYSIVNAEPLSKVSVYINQMPSLMRGDKIELVGLNGLQISPRVSINKFFPGQTIVLSCSMLDGFAMIIRHAAPARAEQPYSYYSLKQTKAPAETPEPGRQDGNRRTTSAYEYMLKQPGGPAADALADRPAVPAAEQPLTPAAEQPLTPAAEEPEAPVETPAAEEPEAPAEAPAAEESEAPAEAPAAEEPEAPAEAPAAEEPEAPAEAPAAEGPEAPAEASAAEESEAPAEAPAAEEPGAPAEEPAGEGQEEPAEEPAEEGEEEPAEEPAEEGEEEPAEEPAEEGQEEPAEEPAEEGEKEPAEEPAEEGQEEPAEEPAEEGEEESAEEPAEEGGEEPAEAPAEEGQEEPADKSAVGSGETPADESAENEPESSVRTLSAQLADGAVAVLSGNLPEGASMRVKELAVSVVKLIDSTGKKDRAKTNLYAFELTIQNADGIRIDPDGLSLTMTVSGGRIAQAVSQGSGLIVSTLPGIKAATQLDCTVTRDSVSFPVDWFAAYRIDASTVAGTLPEPDPLNVSIESSMNGMILLGDTITLTSFVEDAPAALSYQWECDRGDGYKPVDGAVEDSYTFVATEESVLWNWRLTVVADSAQPAAIANK